MIDFQCNEIWKAALIRYEQDTKVAIQCEISESDTPNGLLEEVQRDFAQFREKGKRLRDKIAPVLRLVGLLTETMGESINTVCLMFWRIPLRRRRHYLTRNIRQ